MISALNPTPLLESLIYSVIIYENFNRPPLFREVERFVFPFFSKTLGVMQVKTVKRISDAESVLIGAEKLKSKYLAEIPIAIKEFVDQGSDSPPVGHTLNATYGPISEALKEYNADDDYISGVMQLQEEIVKRFYPSIEKIW